MTQEVGQYAETDLGGGQSLKIANASWGLRIDREPGYPARSLLLNLSPGSPSKARVTYQFFKAAGDRHEWNLLVEIRDDGGFNSWLQCGGRRFLTVSKAATFLLEPIISPKFRTR